MSKRVARIVISALITLIIVAAVYTTVFGAASRAGASSARIQVTAGLLPDLNHSRIQAASASGYYTGLVQPKQQKTHDCDGSSSFDE